MILEILHRLCDRLCAVRDATRVKDIPQGRPLAFMLFSTSVEPRHLAAALDAIEEFHSGSRALVLTDSPSGDALAAIGGGERYKLSIEFRDIREGRFAPDSKTDVLMLLHPWPYMDDEQRRRFPRMRRAFRAASFRRPSARPWIYFMNLELWNGSVRAAFVRRVCNALLQPALGGALRLERGLLERRVFPHLPAAKLWNGDVPCKHPAPVEALCSRRRLTFCIRCGMGLPKPGGNDRSPAASYGPGYALSGHYIGRREFQRFVRENQARVEGYLRMLEFPLLDVGAAPPKMLDFGCGNGRYAPLWLGNGWSYLGVDLSPDNIRFASRMADRCSSESSGQARFILGGMDDPGVLERAPFDLIFMSHVIEHVPDPLELLKELRRLASPAGRLYVETPDAFRYAWDLSERGYANVEHLWDFTPAMLKATVREAGWTDPRVHIDQSRSGHPFIALLARNP